jgi:site-specific DNA recombinase
MANLEFFRRGFDQIATDGSIGDPSGRLAYAYLRVSSKEQADEGRDGLPRQIEHCHEIAAKRGYRIAWAMVYADDASGFDFEDRPMLSKLRKELKARDRRASTVVIEHLDRLSRNADWHQGFLLDEMKMHGVEPVFWKAFSSRIERTVMGAIAQEGMEDAKARMQNGTFNKAAKRGCITAKSPALGLKLVDSQGRERTTEARKNTRYAIDEFKAVAVRFIYDAIAYQDMTTYRLVTALDKRAETDDRFKPNRSKGWSEGRLTNLIKNPVYKGEFIANRLIDRKIARYDEETGVYKKVWVHTKRPEEEWVRIAVPAIVDAATWELANQNLKRNKHNSPHNRKTDYLLAGLLRCSACGWRCHGQVYSRGTAKPRYCCSKTSHVSKQRKQPKCGVPSVRCEVLDTSVWQVVTAMFDQPETLMRGIDAKYSGEGTRAALEQIAYVECQIQASENEDRREHDAYLAGTYSPEEWSAIHRGLVAKRETLQADMARMRAQMVTPEELAAKKRALMQHVTYARSLVNLQDAPFAVKRKIVTALVDEIRVNTVEGTFEMEAVFGNSLHRIGESAGRAVISAMSTRDG